MSNITSLSLEYFAADGHFGNKSSKLVKHYAEDLGFDYLCANTKEQFLDNVSKFTSDKNDKPIIFEVFTNSDDESKALKIVNNLELDTSAKRKIKNIIGDKRSKIAKKSIKK